jgi:exodeoxyribonuclease V alpha subunit
MLAYAITIHKSQVFLCLRHELPFAYCQGCEFPVVVIPLSFADLQMWSRRLLYTAVTRARRLVVFVGCPDVVSIALQSNKDRPRWTRLAKLLRREALYDEDELLYDDEEDTNVLKRKKVVRLV